MCTASCYLTSKNRPEDDYLLVETCSLHITLHNKNSWADVQISITRDGSLLCDWTCKLFIYLLRICWNKHCKMPQVLPLICKENAWKKLCHYKRLRTNTTLCREEHWPARYCSIAPNLYELQSSNTVSFSYRPADISHTNNVHRTGHPVTNCSVQDSDKINALVIHIIFDFR